MKISNATVTSKQNFIEKYHRLMKNIYNQKYSGKNEGNINRVSEISKIHSLQHFFLLINIFAAKFFRITLNGKTLLTSGLS